MNRKSIFLVLLVLLTSLYSSGQKAVLPKVKSGISLNGKIIEKGTNKPVEKISCGKPDTKATSLPVILIMLLKI